MGLHKKYKTIKSNLLSITHIMWDNFKKLMSRGEDLNILEEQSSEILKSSEIFVIKTIPLHKQLYYNIKWFCCFLCTRKKRKKKINVKIIQNLR